MAVLSAAGGAIFLVSSLSNYTCIPIVPRLAGSFPARAVAVLERAGVAGNLACHFNWGEYLIWHLGPKIKVSNDGRRETVYSEATYEENRRFEDGLGDWDAFLRRDGTDMVLVANGTAACNLLQLKPEWSQAYRDSLCSLFIYHGLSLRKRVQEVKPPDLPPDGEGLCFP
jgi:hypothetical protein